MWIRVTQLDINRGVKCSTEKCPVARAIRRAVNWNKSVSVGSGSMTFSSPNGQERDASLPERASDFIDSFDRIGPNPYNGPFSFQIVRPEPFKRGPAGW